VDQPDLSQWPSVKNYLDFLRARPSYREISPKTKVADASSSRASG